jgi:uncharacterized protein YcsI (UPF0317 family)
MTREEFARATGAEVREAVRAGRWRHATHGLAPCYVQANLAIVQVAPGSDVRTDLPGYRVYRDGELLEEVPSIEAHWRPDHVAFLIGCSNSFDEVMVSAGIPQRHLATEDGRISVYVQYSVRAGVPLP